MWHTNRSSCALHAKVAAHIFCWLRDASGPASCGALPKSRATAAQWQRAAELLLARADVAEVTRAIDLALFYDAKLGVGAAAKK